MKILVVAPQPFFTPRGTPFSVYYRTLVTSELGAEIDFLTYGQGQEVDIPNVRFLRIPKFQWMGDVKIGPSMLKAFFDIFIAIRMVWLLLRNKYDVVHAHEESVFLAYFLKPIFRFKLIYDMHSSLPQQLSNFKFTTSKLLISAFKKLEDESLLSSDAIITICPALRDYVDGIIPDKSIHSLIENSIFEPVRLMDGDKQPELPAKQAVFEKYGINVKPEQKLIVYAGTLEEYQGIDILLDAFEEALKQNVNAYLLIVGGTDKQVQEYTAQAEKLNIMDSIKFTGRLPQIEARAFTTAADLLVSPRSAGTNTPLKIYEQLASGIPLVATAIYSHTQVLDNEVSFLVEPNPKDMARGLIEALSSEQEAQRIAKNAQDLYDKEYSPRVYKEKLNKLLEIVR